MENDNSNTEKIISNKDLQRQFLRKNFYSFQNTFGANACRRGHVWRALDAYDYVCVTEKRFF